MSLYGSLTVAALSSIAVAASQDGTISIELNKVETIENDCRFSFLITNQLGTNIEKLSYEVVLFDAESRVERMTVFDFKDIKNGKSRVRQFQIAKTKCEYLSRFLINGAAACEGANLDTGLCEEKTNASNRTALELLN